MNRRHYRSDLKSLSRHLRSELTPAEQKLWMHLRRKQILDVQFFRQKPLGAYVVDFCAPSANLVIEVDGGQHFEESAEARDAERDRYLLDLGYRVLRFTNTQVLKEITDVAAAVHAAIEQGRSPKIPPNPPFSKGGKEMRGAPT